MTKVPIELETSDDLLKRAAIRIVEAGEVLIDNSKSSRYPPWVVKMGRAVRSQILNAKCCSAIDSRDEEFICGFYIGAMIALRHISPSLDQTSKQVSVRLGRSIVERIEAPEIFTEVAESGIADLPEFPTLLSGLMADLQNYAFEKRLRFLEGMIEGNAMEISIRNGPFRLGLAHESQIMMLLYWPEMEGAKSRREAYQILQYLLRDRPAAQRSEETFIRLAKDYGFKARGAVKGGP